MARPEEEEEEREREGGLPVVAHGAVGGGGGARTQLLVAEEVAELKRPRVPLLFFFLYFGSVSPLPLLVVELLSTAAQDGSRGDDEEGCGG